MLGASIKLVDVRARLDSAHENAQAEMSCIHPPEREPASVAANDSMIPVNAPQSTF